MKISLRTPLYILLILSSAFLLSGCTPSEETISKYNQLNSEAKTFLEAKEYSSAVNKYSEATALIPSRPEAYEGIVSIFITKNRLDEAKKIVDESASKLSEADRSKLYINIGGAYYNIKEYDKALNSYELAEGMGIIGEGSDMAKAGLAKVYLQKGDIEKAKRYLDEEFDEDLRMETVLVRSYIESLKDIEKAKSTIESIEPNESWKPSYSSWKEALNSSNDDDLYNSAKLAKEYINNGYPYLAISLLEPKSDAMEEYTDGKYLLGKAYYEHGDYQKSIDTLNNVTSLSEKNQLIFWTMARSYYLLNDMNNAFEYYDRAITYAGDEGQEKLYQEYLDLLFNNGQLTRAQEVLRKAEKIFTDQWVNLYYLKLSYLNKESEKVKYYTGKIKIDELEGNFEKEYLYYKSLISIENGLYDDAKRNLNLYYSIDSFDPKYNLLMGQLNFHEGKLDESRNYLKKAIEYDTLRFVTDDAQKLLARID